MVRRILLALLLLGILGLAIATWGSIGSAMLILCLLIISAALLYQHFLIRQEEDPWQWE